MAGTASKNPRQEGARGGATAGAGISAAYDAFRRGDFAEAERLLGPIIAAEPKNAAALHLLGAACSQAGRNDEALGLLCRAADLAPTDAGTHNTLGIVLRRLERIDEAVGAYERAIALDARLVDALANLGLALRALGRHAESLARFEAAAHLRPQSPDARLNCGNALKDLGRLGEALSAYRAGLELAPNHVELTSNLGVALHESGDHAGALAAFERALSLRPSLNEARIGRARALRDLGRADDAIAEWRRVLEAAPENVEAIANLANQLRDSGRRTEAIPFYEKALAIRPDAPDILCNLAIARYESGQLDAAEAILERVAALKPDYAVMHTNLGVLRSAQGRPGDAVAAYRHAIALDRNDAKAMQNLCAALLQIGDVAGALEIGRRAVAHDPTKDASRFNLACAELLSGDLATGFANYEARPHDANVAHWRNAAPLWSLAAPKGSRVLVYVEQGMGDAIQFARYLPRLIARGDRLVLGLYKPLRRLLGGLPGTTAVTPEEPAPPVDYQIRLLSLPAAFGTTLETIPAQVPYLRPPVEAVAAWRARLSRDALNVGLVWRGNPNHKNDRNRSIEPSVLAPLLGVQSVRWVSLQKVVREGDLDALRRAAPIEDWTQELADFTDTAALIGALDLVISVDTSVAHLAGALAKPVWLLLPYAPDWRWMLGRDDSPWYPTARLVRQTRAGDWPGVIARLRDDLHREAARQIAAPREDNAATLRAKADRLAEAGDRAGAIALYRRALVLEPESPDLLGNLAALLIDDGALDEGMALCRAAIARAPERPRNHVNLALALLAQGKLAEGFDEYEWRYRNPAVAPAPGTAPPWTPDVPKGETVIVEAEQGVGDEILYASMLGDLMRTGARVIAEADARLVPLLKRSFPGIDTMARLVEGQRTVKSRRVVYSLPAASLGRFFRRSEADMPRLAYLKAEPARTEALRAKLHDGRLLCGLAWWSRRAETGARRTPPLEAWAPLLTTKGVRFVSLQYDADAAGIEALRRHAPEGIADEPSVDARLDLDGLAALIDALDLVITIGNSTADLAGALGKDTWVLLPTNPDWRWQVKREDSAWYPRVRLFRQSTPGRWDDVMTRVTAALNRRLRATGGGRP